MNNISGVFTSSIQGLNKLKQNNNNVASPTKQLLSNSSQLDLHERGSIAQFVVVEKSAAYISNRTLFNKPSELPAYQPKTGFDFEEVANTVLSYMKNGLIEAERAGLSQLELQDISQQMREGFNTGFDEALSELDEIGLLTDGLADDINRSRAIVDQGLSKISEGFVDRTNSSNKVEANFLSATEQARTSEIKITTKEGDEVTISFAQLYAEYQRTRFVEAINGQSLQEGSNNAPSREQTSYERYFEHVSTSYESLSYAFTIDGDLNDDELDAIYNLIEQISKLQELFFSGDFQKAFEAMTDLTLDDDLATTEIDMAYSSRSIAVQTYESVADVNTVRQPLGNNDSSYIERFNHLAEDTFTKANKVLSDASQMIPNLINEVINITYREPGDRAAQLNQQIADIKKAT